MQRSAAKKKTLARVNGLEGFFPDRSLLQWHVKERCMTRGTYVVLFAYELPFSYPIKSSRPRCVQSLLNYLRGSTVGVGGEGGWGRSNVSFDFEGAGGGGTWAK